MTNALLLGILICRAIFIICQTYLAYCTFFWSTRPPLWLWHSLCSFYSLKRYLTSLLLNNIMFVFNACHISTLFIYDSDPSAIGHPTQAASLLSLLIALVQHQIFVQSVSHSLPENPRMPSARFFAECRITSTRQSYYLPSAKQHALGEQLALGGISLCRVPASWHSAKTHFAECRPVDTR